jgi:hypothetical protein
LAGVEETLAWGGAAGIASVGGFNRGALFKDFGVDSDLGCDLGVGILDDVDVAAGVLPR